MELLFGTQLTSPLSSILGRLTDDKPLAPQDTLTFILKACDILKQAKIIGHDRPVNDCPSGHDPEDLLISYGVGQCAHFSNLFIRILRETNAFNATNSRLVQLNDHIVSEVNLRGKWLMFDCDPGTDFQAFLNGEGTFASSEEIFKNPSIINRSSLYLGQGVTRNKINKYRMYFSDAIPKVEASIGKATVRNKSAKIELPAGGVIRSSFVVIRNYQEIDTMHIHELKNLMDTKKGFEKARSYYATHLEKDTNLSFEEFIVSFKRGYIKFSDEKLLILRAISNTISFPEAFNSWFENGFPFVIHSISQDTTIWKADFENCDDYANLPKASFPNLDGENISIEFYFNPNFYLSEDVLTINELSNTSKSHLRISISLN
ncbi:MAG: hypothetical protein AAF502_15765 [Bacteroidota bacterium]